MVQQHGLSEVGAWRVHHHFKVKPGEYLISQVERSAGGTAKHVVSVKTARDLKGQGLVPIAFTYSERDRQWWPVQFYAFVGHDHIGDALSLRYGKLNEKIGLEALGDLGKALLTAGLSAHIGISINWADLFGWAPGFTMLETTNGTGRSQVFKVVPDDGDAKQYVTTHQFFNQRCEAAPGPTRHGCTIDCASSYHCSLSYYCADLGLDGHHSLPDNHDRQIVHYNVHDDGK
eukprot:UN0612